LLFTFAFGLIFKYSLTSLFQKYPNLTKTIYIGDNVEETTQIIKKTNPTIKTKNIAIAATFNSLLPSKVASPAAKRASEAKKSRVIILIIKTPLHLF
jgi:hypothetical protein